MQNRRFSAWMSMGILISVLIIIFCNRVIINRLNASHLKLEITTHQHELQTLSLNKLQELVLHNKNKWEKIEFLKKLHNQRSQIVMLLDDIARVLPPEITLRQIIVKEYVLTINGECNNNSTAVMWLERLQLLSWVNYGKIIDFKTHESGNNFAMEIFLRNHEKPVHYAAA